MQLLCSSGAFGRYPVLIDHLDIARYAPSLPVDGIEIMYYPEWTTRIEEIAADLLATGLRFPALHVEKNVAPALLNADPAERAQGRLWLSGSCRLGQMVGARVAIFHLWGAPDSDEHIDLNLSILSECIDIAEECQMELAIETIPCVKSTPLEVIQQVIERDKRSKVALDTEFLAIHGQINQALDTPWLWSGELVRHIHLKDYDGQQYTADGYRRYLHPGEGKLDFPYIFARLQQHQFKGNLSLEASVVGPDFTRDSAKLQSSLEHLRTMLAEPLLP
ncbi:MAG TPA: sugar phosphate isomerase/epimerase family protein [Ktedonobacteraceae bacterium]